MVIYSIAGAQKLIQIPLEAFTASFVGEGHCSYSEAAEKRGLHLFRSCHIVILTEALTTGQGGRSPPPAFANTNRPICIAR